MGRFVHIFAPMLLQVLFSTPSIQLQIDRSCYSYPNFSPSAALATAKNIGTISTAWVSYYYDNYDNKNADEDKMRLVEQGLEATFGLLSLRQPELGDWHRRVIKDDIETINTTFHQIATPSPKYLRIHCNLDWVSETHEGRKYKKDTDFHKPDDADTDPFRDIPGTPKKGLKRSWMWSHIHQRWMRLPDKKELCGKLDRGFAMTVSKSPVAVIQVCPRVMQSASQRSEIRQLRDEAEVYDESGYPEFKPKSLDQVAFTVTGVLVHELSHINAKTTDETYVDSDGRTVTAYGLKGVKALAGRSSGEALHNAESYVYLGVGLYFAEGPIGVEGRWTTDWGDGESLIPPGQC